MDIETKRLLVRQTKAIQGVTDALLQLNRTAVNINANLVHLGEVAEAKEDQPDVG